MRLENRLTALELKNSATNAALMVKVPSEFDEDLLESETSDFLRSIGINHSVASMPIVVAAATSFEFNYISDFGALLDGVAQSHRRIGAVS